MSALSDQADSRPLQGFKAVTQHCIAAPLELLALRLDGFQRKVARLAPQLQRRQLAPLFGCRTPKTGTPHFKDINGGTLLEPA